MHDRYLHRHHGHHHHHVSALEKLPVELVTLILEFLSDQDIFNLCMSKIFFRQIKTQPWFYNLIRIHLHHLLIHYDFNSSLLFHQGILVPVVFNTDIFFAVDVRKAYYLLKTPCILLPWTTSFNTIHQLWHPQYNTTNAPVNNLTDFPCTHKCLCVFYNNISIALPHIPHCQHCLYCGPHFVKKKFPSFTEYIRHNVTHTHFSTTNDR